MQVKDIAAAIEQFAPLVYQESYDNCGLQVGSPDAAVTGALLTLDVTEAVVDEAIASGCNIIVAHHPLIFGGLKRITGRNYVERTVLKAIKHDIAIYAAHTNLDNMRMGVNDRIARKLGLVNTHILAPKAGTLSKLHTYAPPAVAGRVREAMFAAGAGSVGNYTECSFNTMGHGSFRPGPDTHPAIGQAGGTREWVAEEKIEVLVAKHHEQAVLAAMRSAHCYEEVACELVPLPNVNYEIGAGLVGDLEQPTDIDALLQLLRTNLQAGCVRHTAPVKPMVSRIALCGGSGSFLLPDAIRAGADVFVTADFKYHQFFDAEGKIVIADIGHYETEQYTPEIFADILQKKFPNFAILFSKVLTNPVKYFY